MTDTTVIRNAAWLVAWDGAAPGGGHRYLKDADLAFRGEAISHLGPRSRLESSCPDAPRQSAETTRY